MNYDNRNPTISFRIDHNRKTKLDKLALMKKLSSANELSKEIVEMYLKNKLVEKTEDLQTEKTKLQIEKLKHEVQYLKIKNQFYNPAKATVHINPEIVVESATKEIIHSPYDSQNKRLQCVECMCLFGWHGREDFINQLGEFHRHLLSKHNRELNPIEKDVVLKLEYEGDST